VGGHPAWVHLGTTCPSPAGARQQARRLCSLRWPEGASQTDRHRFAAGNVGHDNNNVTGRTCFAGQMRSVASSSTCVYHQALKGSSGLVVGGAYPLLHHRLAQVSTLWTPSGEHRVPRAPSAGTSEASSEPTKPLGAPSGGQPGPAAGSPGQAGRPPAASGAQEGPTPEEVRRAQEELKAVQEQLLKTPAEVVVANHAMGLWDLAALHLSSKPPQLAQARLAIDALSALLEGLRGRLGEAEATLVDGLTQIRMAFVQVANATSRRDGTPGQAETQGTANSEAGA